MKINPLLQVPKASFGVVLLVLLPMIVENEAFMPTTRTATTAVPSTTTESVPMTVLTSPRSFSVKNFQWRRRRHQTSTPTGTSSTTTTLRYSFDNNSKEDADFYYDVLGVSRNRSGITEKEIKTAYRKLAKQYHPDANPEFDTTVQFQKLNHAYDIVMRDFVAWQKRQELYTSYTTSFSTNEYTSGTPPPSYYGASNGFSTSAAGPFTGTNGQPVDLNVDDYYRSNGFGMGSYGASPYAAWENNFKGPRPTTTSFSTNDYSTPDVKQSPYTSWENNYKGPKTTSSSSSTSSETTVSDVPPSSYAAWENNFKGGTTSTGKSKFSNGRGPRPSWMSTGKSDGVQCDNEYSFGNTFQPQYGQQPRAADIGKDVSADLSVDFKTAIFGGTANATITHLETCSTCNGSGIAQYVSNSTRDVVHGDFKCHTCHGHTPMKVTKTFSVTIDANAKESMIRVPGEGDVGPNNGPPGDLYLFIKATMSTEEHKLLQRLRNLHRHEKKQQQQNHHQHRKEGDESSGGGGENGETNEDEKEKKIIRKRWTEPSHFMEAIRENARNPDAVTIHLEELERDVGILTGGSSGTKPTAAAAAASAAKAAASVAATKTAPTRIYQTRKASTTGNSIFANPANVTNLRP